MSQENTHASAPFNFGNSEAYSIKLKSPIWLSQETKYILATTLENHKISHSITGAARLQSTQLLGPKTQFYKTPHTTTIQPLHQIRYILSPKKIK